jgi:dTDP-4-dehydrorhamnose 3,5-epimerase
MEFKLLEILERKVGVIEIRPRRHSDDRGFFCETWSRKSFDVAGIELDFVQDNHSYSAASGTLRGLHFQVPPFAQAKLVRVVRGAIFDVAVDIRTGSPNFGRWVGITVSRDSWNQVLVPVGFAHGFVTLEPDTEVCYKATQIYSPAHERSIRYDDPAIGIAWPSIGATINLSPKDAAAPMLAEIETGFVYQ